MYHNTQGELSDENKKISGWILAILFMAMIALLCYKFSFIWFITKWVGIIVLFFWLVSLLFNGNKK